MILPMAEIMHGRFAKIHDRMFRRWEKTWNDLGVKNADYKEFRKIYDMYSEKERAYHHLGHVKSCLEELDSVRSLVNNPTIVELAIWFHDAIYDTRKKDNEWKSAGLAMRTAFIYGLDEDSISELDNLIMATKHDVPPVKKDEKYIVDIDLSILGKPKKEYDQYDKAIRKEYAWVPLEDYVKGRTAVLEGFLARESIYNTSFFREKYEAQAKKNMQRSIEALARI